jgi:hypothetical protein
VYRNIYAIAFGAALILPAVVGGQERPRNNDRIPAEEQTRQYEDHTHKDVHQWNSKEDQAYRRYLEGHHKKYHEFSKASKRQQSDYWNWRHNHPDEDRR